jgi:predicted TIM-barrel fold metal-dependent hydrolase
MANVTQLKTGKPTARELLAGIKIIDTDTHFSEPWDLWTSRAPAHLKDRVPRMVNNGDNMHWVIDTDTMLAPKCGFSAVMRDGSKAGGFTFFDRTVEDAHEGASNGKARLKVMDEQGIHAQIVYPNLLGFGGQMGKTVPSDLRLASVQIFNDAMADMQQESGDRILPMILLPWWDLKESLKELERGAKRGMRGINITSDSQDHPGLPPLSDPHWDPLWHACIEGGFPVNFHIGGSDSANSWFANGSWPGLDNDQKLAMGGALLLAGNMRVMGNIMMSRMLDRLPGLKMVSVESGVGWVPYILEALEYLSEEQTVKRNRSFKQVFLEHFYACTFFEKDSLIATVRQLGADNILFETDFPHPACLYPDSLEYLADTIVQLTPEERFKIFSGNAAKLYNIDIGDTAASRA